jgi:uncharacterized protein involved in exopolysaccharide biosynthesis
MRRRIIVFCAVFLVSAIASLTYTFMRPAIYLASARLQVTPAAKMPRAEAPAADSTPAVLVELQILNSRPLLEKVVARLAEQGDLSSIHSDPVLAVQDMLKVTRVEGTNVIQIEAKGPEKTLLPRLVNGLIETYREQQAAAGKSSTMTELSEAREEARVIESRVAEKKQAMEVFRLQSNIVSAERGENRTLSRLTGLGNSLNAAEDREAIAAGKVHALEQALREGKRGPLAKDNPTVAGLENRLSQLREEWRSLERQFTPQYLDMDPHARALRTRISNLEQQLDSERGKSQQDALGAAKDELASAQATVRRVQQQMAGDKQSVQNFTRRMAEFQTMQEEMRGLEQMRLAARQRLLGLEASEMGRKPRIQVLETAVLPETAWRPDYWRDAGFSLLASLVLGFLAVWFVEFFDRSEPVPAGPSTVIIPQPWVTVTPMSTAQLGVEAAAPALTSATQAPLLSAPRFRELNDDELRRLLSNAAPENLPLLVFLLSGLTSAALMALRVAHVDTEMHRLTVPGEPDYVLPLDGPLRKLTARCTGLSGETVLFPSAIGKALTEEDVHSVVAFSAHDANLKDAHEIKPESLRHTYLAFLVRQGLRFSELNRVVGRVSTDTLNVLAGLSPQSNRVGLEEIDRILPAVRDLSLN